MEIPENGGNVIFPEGNALKYLAECFTDELPENPYVEAPRDLRCVSFSPNDDVLGGNVYRKDIMEIMHRKGKNNDQPRNIENSYGAIRHQKRLPSHVGGNDGEVVRDCRGDELKMKKIIVIGCPGSGKTSFAEKLCDKLGLPLFYLDAIWHKSDKTHIAREDFDVRLAEILALDSWIIDGNYSRTIERRIVACDTVILFDLPTEVCLDGAISRLGKKRYDIPWIDTELDPNLKKEIEEFRSKNLPTIYALIDKYKDGKSVVVFKSREQADAFLNGETIAQLHFTMRGMKI